MDSTKYTLLEPKRPLVARKPFWVEGGKFRTLLFSACLAALILYTHFVDYFPFHFSTFPATTTDKGCQLPQLGPFDAQILKFWKPPTPLNCSAVKNKHTKKAKYNLLFRTDYHSNLIMMQDVKNFGFESCCYKPFSRKSETKIEYSKKCYKINSSRTRISRKHEFIVVYCLPATAALKNETSTVPKNRTLETSNNSTSTVPKNGTSETSKNETSTVPKNGTTETSKNATSTVPKNGTSETSKNAASTVPKNGTSETSKNSISTVPKNGTSETLKNATSTLPKNGTSETSKNSTSTVPQKGTSKTSNNGTLTVSQNATSTAPRHRRSARKKVASKKPKKVVSEAPKNLTSATSTPAPEDPKHGPSTTPETVTSPEPKKLISKSKKKVIQKTSKRIASEASKKVTSAPPTHGTLAAPHEITSTAPEKFTSPASEILVTSPAPNPTTEATKKVTPKSPKKLKTKAPKKVKPKASKKITSAAPEKVTSVAPESVTLAVPQTVTSSAPEELSSAAPNPISKPPKKLSSKALKKAKPKAPKKAKPKASKKVTSAAPEKVTSAVPTIITSAVPQTATSATPAEVSSGASKPISKAPKKLTSKAPKKVKPKAPKKVKPKASKKVTSAAPEILTTPAPTKITSLAPEKVTSAVPTIITSAVPQTATSATPAEVSSGASKPISKAPKKVKPKAPKKVKPKASKKVTSATPEILTTPAPTKITSLAPEKLTSLAPAKVTSAAPVKVTSAAPAKVTSAAPAKLTSAAPAKVTSAAPAKVTSAAPAKLTSAAPGKVTSAAPGNVTSAARTNITSLVPRKVTLAAPTNTTSQAPGKTKTLAIPKTEHQEAPPELEAVDMFHFVRLKSKVEARLQSISSPSLQVNVLVIGLDSVSHMNLIRTMPKTYQYLTHNLGAIGMNGYTKVGDNTFPNLVPALSGFSMPELGPICWDKRKSPFFDKCPFIWKNFSEEGYRTSFAEDAATMGIFNSLQFEKKGFKNPPTDYYLRTLTYPMDQLIGHTERPSLCYGPRLGFSVLLNNIKNMVYTMGKERRYFQFTWATSLFHNDLNQGTLGDEEFYETLKWMKDKGYLENTALIVMSDHGIRFGKIRETFQGKIEERMPFLYYTFPKWFSERYSSAFRNLKLNRYRLTSPFDFYETLKDLLHLKNIENGPLKERQESLSVRPTLPRGISLFLPVPDSRRCESAGIEPNFCVCHQMDPVSVKTELVQEAASFVVDVLNKMLLPFPQCSTLSLKEVSSAEVMHLQANSTDAKVFAKTKPTWYSIMLSTVPGDAVFEAALSVSHEKQRSWALMGGISRINSYGTQSRCVTEYIMKMYCFCQ